MTNPWVWAPTLYVIIGLISAMGLSVYDARDLARRNNTDSDSYPVDWGIFFVVLCFWPFVSFALLASIVEWSVEKLARVDKLPEVVERKQKALEESVLNDG